MSLVGKYVNVAQRYTLTISEANDSNGTGKGNMQWGDINVPVTIHYHFKNSTDSSKTNLVVSGTLDDPNRYFAAAGYTSGPAYGSIQIGMSLATEGRVDTFVTRLDRQ